LYARKSSEDLGKLAGAKITLEDACTLKTVCFGSATYVPSIEWVRSGFAFHTPENLHAFGLKATKGAVKAFKLLCQAYILKNLLFQKNVTKAEQNQKEGRFTKYEREDDPDNQKPDLEPGWEIDMLRPNYETQKEILTCAIIELLWKCGSQKQAVLVIPGEHPCFEASKIYSTDGVTEKLHILGAKNLNELTMFVRKHISFFMEDKGGGLICLLYSIVLSKGIKELKKDMQDMVKKPLIDVDDNASNDMKDKLHSII